MFAVLERLVAYGPVQITFQGTEHLQFLLFFPEYVEQLLNDLFGDVHAAGDTGGVEAKRGVVEPEDTFESFDVPPL